MNRYIFIHRLTGPAILLLLGVIALLHQADLASWNLFVPLLLILLGLLKLAERAALASEPYADGPYPGSSYPGSPYPGSPYAGSTSSSIAPAPEAGNDRDGGKL